MCVSEQTFTGSDNGLSPDRRHAIIWTNAGILLIRALGTNFSEILSKIHTIPFKKMYFIMSSVKWRSSFLGLNVWRYDKEFLHFIIFETNYIHKQINKTLKQCHRLLKMHNKIVHLNLSWRWLKKNCTLMNVLCSAHFIQNELIWARITKFTPNMHFVIPLVLKIGSLILTLRSFGHSTQTDRKLHSMSLLYTDLGRPRGITSTNVPLLWYRNLVTQLNH